MQKRTRRPVTRLIDIYRALVFLRPVTCHLAFAVVVQFECPLVTELVHGYLDAAVCKWLKENKPQPQHGRNWHQWVNDQYGLRKLVQHIYALIGVSKTCHNMRELRDKMAEMYGKSPVQLRPYLPTIPAQ